MQPFNLLLLAGLLGCHSPKKGTDTSRGDTGAADSDTGSDTDAVDSDTCTESTWYIDADGDGYGGHERRRQACEAPEGWLADSSDCDDFLANVNPSATEVCDGIDDDCDGLVDDADPSLDTSTGSVWYADADGDGYVGTTVLACVQPAGSESVATDCDDSDPAYHPGASETDCTDPNDYNCDGSVDYADADGDGHVACDDCNDADAAVNSGVTEVCNGIDDNCDGVVDEATAADAATWYIDADSDGFGDASVSSVACEALVGYVADATDCDDTRADIYPGAVEICADGVANDCDDADGSAALAFCAGAGLFSLSGSDAELVGEEALDEAGKYVAAAGDVNGDGLDDLLVATDYVDREGQEMVYVVNGPVSGEVSLGDADAVLLGNGVGASDAGVGDVDGDGYADLLLGAFAADKVYLVPGPLSGEMELSEVDTQIVGEDDSLMGSSVAGPGDVDGDGLADLLIGAPWAQGRTVESDLGHCPEEVAYADYDYGLEYGRFAGAAYLFLGSRTGTLEVSDADAQLIGEDGGDGAGMSVARAGDLDGDGLADLYLSATGNCEGGIATGAAYVVLSPASGDLYLEDADAKVLGEEYTTKGLGSPLSGAGDTDGDGTPDLLMGDWYYGVVFLFLSPVEGSVSVSTADAKFKDAGGRPGPSISSAGDIDADGFDDLLIGNYGEDTGGRLAGATYILFGPFSGSMSLDYADETFIGRENYYSGQSVAGVGDEDGDGLSDVLIGALGAEAGWPTGTGAAYLLLGSGALLSGTGAI